MEGALSDDRTWKRCSACKQPIELGAEYFVCSVSTCNRKRTALQFCSVSCWEVHLPVARHREAWAEERRAPRTPEPAESAPTPAKREKRRILADPKPASSAPPGRTEPPREVLIVASRLKDYVRAECGFNTSDRVLEPLSEIVRRAVREAIANADRDGRKTILDRDVPRP